MVCAGTEFDTASSLTLAASVCLRRCTEVCHFGVDICTTARAHEICCCTAEKGQRPDAIIMDAPRIYHLPKLLFALGVEGMLVAIGVLAYRELSTTFSPAA